MKIQTFTELSSIGNDRWSGCCAISIGSSSIFVDWIWLIDDRSSEYRMGDKHGEADVGIASVGGFNVWPIPRNNRNWFWWAGDDASNLEIVLG